MVSTSKILTVSYGTFSCTLEGFDDSFETMKAIAEYFRDLAADDRYFGAEPPVPDAEMLARIAEREISRRVDARQERGAIVLRPSDPAPAPVMQDPVAPTVAEPAAAPIDTPERPQTVVAEVMPDATPTQTTEDSIAAKLRRIRAVVARADDTPEATYSEDQHAEAFLTDDTAALDAVLAEGRDADAPALTDEVDGALDALMAETAADTVDEDDSTLADFLAGVDLPQTDASDMAVTDESLIDAPAADADEQDDDTAALLASLAQDAVPAAEVETEAEVDSDAPAPEQAQTESDDLDDDDVAGILDRLAGMSTAKPAAPAVEAEAETEIEQDQHSADDTAAVVADLIDPAPQASATAPKPEDNPAPAPVRARVVKIKRSALELAVAKGQIEAADDDDASDWDDDTQDDWSAVSEETSLSPEEEDELRRELAEVEAELAAAPEAEDDADTVESIFADLPDDRADLQDRRPARDHLEPAANERDMTRIIAKTMSEMEEPETASRRSAIAHLRAAVAATRADRDAGVTAGEDTISEAFRADLASVVRPRRPRAEGVATPRPGAEPARPAPLKLVAEQRIDAPTAPAAPVRPRRISVAQAQAEAGFDIDEDSHDDTSATSGFADYAEQQGARSLAEIVEAAASYLAFVEGRDQFSRPQLMTRARAVIGEDFSREDGLRSFGLLLRQGKIQKARGGRFTVSDDIGFQPSARRAG